MKLLVCSGWKTVRHARASWKYLYQSELRKETSFTCFLHHTVGFCHLFECIMLCGSLAKGIGTLDHLKKHTCAVVLQSLVLDFDSAYKNSSSKLTSHYFYTLIYSKVVAIVWQLDFEYHWNSTRRDTLCKGWPHAHRKGMPKEILDTANSRGTTLNAARTSN